MQELLRRHPVAIDLARREPGHEPLHVGEYSGVATQHAVVTEYRQIVRVFISVTGNDVVIGKDQEDGFVLRRLSCAGCGPAESDVRSASGSIWMSIFG